MKTVLVLSTILAFAVSLPAPEPVRRFMPEENDPYRIKYLMYRDEEGLFHFEDLTKPVKSERKVTIDDVTIYLYTQRNIDEPKVFKTNDLVGLENSGVYDPKKPNYFIIHGLRNTYASNVNVVTRSAILEKVDANIFVVDWGRLANKIYITAKGAVPQIGVYVGDFINRMMERYDLTPLDFRLIGHSLGAHVAGCAGAEVNGLVEYIIGLDPAGPLYTIKNTENRLDATDGYFVQVIHTSATTLGFGSSIGDSDYYPNNGASQPGCGLDLLGTCAHSRSYYLYEESILHGGFGSVQCDSYKSFKQGKCDNNHSSHLGSLDVDVTARGDYYLNTDKSPPFSLT